MSLKVINKEYLVSSLKNFNKDVLSKIYAKIPKNKNVLDKFDQSDEGTLMFNGNVIGSKGEKGDDGKSSYDLALENGFIGTESEWLESLKGLKGDSGLDGKNGINGESAYQIALNNGFSGSEIEWLSSLKGEQGETGSSGQKGDTGENGIDGISVIKVEQTTTSSDDNGINVITVTLSNGKTFEFNIKNGSKGSDGEKGDKGDSGQDASLNGITAEDIGAASSVHFHGYMKTITLSTVEPTTVADGEIVMVYEE